MPPSFSNCCSPSASLELVVIWTKRRAFSSSSPGCGGTKKVCEIEGLIGDVDVSFGPPQYRRSHQPNIHDQIRPNGYRFDVPDMDAMVARVRGVE
jgi:hypothetical protein